MIAISGQNVGKPEFKNNNNKVSCNSTLCTWTSFNIELKALKNAFNLSVNLKHQGHSEKKQAKQRHV